MENKDKEREQKELELGSAIMKLCHDSGMPVIGLYGVLESVKLAIAHVFMNDAEEKIKRKSMEGISG